MRIATQNLRWGGEPTAPGCDGLPRLKRLVSIMEGSSADVLVLIEYKSGKLGDELRELLADAGYPHLASHQQTPFALGTAIASRRPFSTVELPIKATTEHWRSIGIDVDGVAVFGFYFPLKEAKSLYWDWVLANAALLKDREVILIGDFNTGKIRIDELNVTFDWQDKLAALEQLGFVDTWRAAYPERRDYTWYSSTGNGFRLDHIWASSQMSPRIQHVWHQHAPEQRITARELAAAAGYSSYSGANMQYGLLGAAFWEFCPTILPKRKDGSSIWTCALTEGVSDFQEKEDEWIWKLRPYVAEGLTLSGVL